MYLKRPVDGLEPLASYTVSVSIDLATNVPLATFGIGGSPGESVYVKAGASTVEPRAELDDLNYLRMNIDKANQSQSGAQMRVIGNVAHPDFIDDEYRIKELASGPEFLSVSADGEGRAWLIVGTDSGFEGLTPALLRPDRLHSHPLRYALVHPRVSGVAVLGSGYDFAEGFRSVGCGSGGVGGAGCCVYYAAA